MVNMAKSIIDTKKKRGRPVSTGIGTPIMVRLQPAALASLDAWIDRQPDPKPSRPEAIRQLVNLAMAKARK